MISAMTHSPLAVRSLIGAVLLTHCLATFAATVIEPLILIDETGSPQACGSKIRHVDEGLTVSVYLYLIKGPLRTKTLFRASARRDGARLEIERADLANEDLRLAALLSKQADETGDYVASAELSLQQHSDMFRRLMLSGGTLQLESADGEAIRVRIRGPAPAQVFRAYLQCTGDLY